MNLGQLGVTKVSSALHDHSCYRHHGKESEESSTDVEQNQSLVVASSSVQLKVNDHGDVKEASIPDLTLIEVLY